MHTYLTLNKSGSLNYYFDISSPKISLYKLSNISKLYLSCNISKCGRSQVQIPDEPPCYVWQCCMVLKVIQGYRVVYIVTCIGAPQYKTLVLGLPSLCTLRQYIRNRCNYCIQCIFLFIIAIYISVITIPCLNTQIHTYLYSFLYSSSYSLVSSLSNLV